MQSDRSLSDGHVWSLFLPSFSHVGVSHIFGNMLMLMYLGRKIHELLGPAKFIGLYLCGAAAGTIATDVSYRFGGIGAGGEPNSFTRYVHILNNERPESMKSLGASDAVMAMIGFYYMCMLHSSFSFVLINNNNNNNQHVQVSLVVAYMCFQSGVL